GTGNLIDNNDVKDCEGNKTGYTSDGEYGANGIYLDHLSCNLTINNNKIYNCGVGIYMQNSRNNTITSNTCSGNFEYQLFINHGGTILSGGYDNPTNDLDYTPLGYTGSPQTKIISYDHDDDPGTPDETIKYYWASDPDSSVVYYYNDKGTKLYVYLNEEGSNNISSNDFIPYAGELATVNFTTWRKVDENTIFDLTSNSNFIDEFGSNKINASVVLEYTDVYDKGVIDYVGKGFLPHDIDENNLFRGLKKFKIKRMFGTGKKFYKWY
ncbi:MAG: hypothetical protein GQ534_06630, partial [Candidatus Delongbacteria bacterium]|nr:hypothetical protein [Candidatus Delongbacteria bacterium]